ncbi:MAG: putative O-glycosylation ligase, exosortase A system-associated [Candidatus Zixiibacteriota bacterium]
MDQSKDRVLPKRGDTLYGFITSERIWYLLLIFFSLISGIFLLISPMPEVVLGIVSLILICLLLFFHPFLGILAYIILSYTRVVEDYIPPLANLHFTRILTIVLIIIWLIRTALITKKIFLWEKEFNVLYVLLLVAGISIPFSFWPTYSFEHSVDFLKTFVFVFMLVHLVDDLKKFKVFIWVFLLVHIFLAITPVRMFIALGPEAVQMRLGTATRGFLGDAHDFALAVTLVLPFSFYLFINEKNKSPRFLLFVSMIVLFWGIVSTSSRGGFVTLVVIISYLLFKSQKKLVGIILILFILATILILAPKEFWERQSTIISYQEDPSALGRIVAWKAGLTMFLDRPLTGVGMDCFSIAYGARYHLPQVKEWIAAHNAYIQIGAELGVLGLTCYLLLIYLIYKENNRLQKSIKRGPLGNNFYITISQALKASLIAYAVGSLFLSAAYYPHLYILIGLTLINKLLVKKELGPVFSNKG